MLEIPNNEIYKIKYTDPLGNIHHLMMSGRQIQEVLHAVIAVQREDCKWVKLNHGAIVGEESFKKIIQ